MPRIVLVEDLLDHIGEIADKDTLLEAVNRAKEKDIPTLASVLYLVWEKWKEEGSLDFHKLLHTILLLGKLCKLRWLVQGKCSDRYPLTASELRKLLSHEVVRPIEPAEVVFAAYMMAYSEFEARSDRDVRKIDVFLEKVLRRRENVEVAVKAVKEGAGEAKRGKGVSDISEYERHENLKRIAEELTEMVRKNPIEFAERITNPPSLYDEDKQLHIKFYVCLKNSVCAEKLLRELDRALLHHWGDRRLEAARKLVEKLHTALEAVMSLNQLLREIEQEGKCVGIAIA